MAEGPYALAREAEAAAAEAGAASGVQAPTVSRRNAVTRYVPIPGLLRLAALIGFIYLGWYQTADFTGVLGLAAIWGLATVGLGLVLGSAGQMSLCQASFVLAGAYTYGAFAKTYSDPTLVALIAGGLVGAAVALIVSPVLRARGYYLALATIAVSLLVDRVVTTASWIPGGSAGLAGIPTLQIGSWKINSEGSYLTFTVILLVVVIALLHWRYGVGAARRAIQALHHDEDLLAGFGGNPAWLKLRLFIVSGLLAGLAGGLYAGDFGYVSDVGFGLQESFALALAVVIGGSGRLIGAVVGALVYELTFVVLPDNLAAYRFALLGAIVIIVVHFFPRGVTPSRHDFDVWTEGLRRRLPRRRLAEADAEHHELEPVEPLGLGVTDVCKSYGALRAVDGITLSIRPGTLTALIGPNGAGKTTLLDLIAGDQRPTSGQIMIGGDDAEYLGRIARARLGIARTYQRVRLIPSLTVLENVLIGVDQAARKTGRLSERRRVGRARAALADVGLVGRERARVGNLTFGDRRLVEMARAIASRPRLVLLDEPSSGLNVEETEDMAFWIQDIKNLLGITVLMVEHDMSLVSAVSDRVMALNYGRPIATGTPAEVQAHPEVVRAYLGG